jgi:uncharacterized membrane protein YeiH
VTHRLSYANVVATLALFTALGGASIAVRNVGIESTPVHFSTRDPAQLVMQTASVDATILPG